MAGWAQRRVSLQLRRVLHVPDAAGAKRVPAWMQAADARRVHAHAAQPLLRPLLLLVLHTRLLLHHPLHLLAASAPHSPQPAPDSRLKLPRPAPPPLRPPPPPAAEARHLAGRSGSTRTRPERRRRRALRVCNSSAGYGGWCCTGEGRQASRPTPPLAEPPAPAAACRAEARAA